MGAIEQLVKVSITQDTQAVAQESFSALLILGPTKAAGWDSGERVRTYFEPAEMLQDGFAASSPEYRRAQAMFSQPVVPSLFKVGNRTGQSAAQVDELAVGTLTPDEPVSLVVDGVRFSYAPSASDTAKDVLDELVELLADDAPVTGAVSGTGAAAKLTLTAKNTGEFVDYTGSSTALSVTPKTAAAGIVADLAAIAAADAGWYGVVLCSATDAEILQAAPWVEGNRKLCLALSTTAEVAKTSSEDDVGSRLKAAGYRRVGLAYKPTEPQEGFDAAWLGSMLPTLPGSSNWAFRNLSGITAEVLSASQQTALIGSPVSGVKGKNVNIYQNVGGVNITQMGTAAGGQYFDITHGIDWLQSKIKTNIFAALSGSQKIPYTDVGTSVLLSAVKSGLDEGVNNGLIDGASQNADGSIGVQISVAPVASVAKNQRANRIAPPINFSCRLQGAVNAVDILGTVSV